MSMWVCPHCGKMNLDYEKVEFYDDQCFFPRECRECHALGEEWYAMEFIWHENVNTEYCLPQEWEKKDWDWQTSLN